MQRDRPALFAVSGVGRGESSDPDRQALCEVDREIDEVADIAEKNSAAVDLVLVPAVGRHARRAHGTGHLPHLDALEVGERTLAQGAEAAVMADPERRAGPAALAQRGGAGGEPLPGHGGRRFYVGAVFGL